MPYFPDNGNGIPNLNRKNYISKYLKASLNRLKCLQRRVSRKVKGSKNKKKAVYKMAKVHGLISR